MNNRILLNYAKQTAGGKSGEITPVSEYNVKANGTNLTTNGTFMECLTEITNINIGNKTVLGGFFQNAINLKVVEVFDTTNVTQMNNMFYNCGELENVPIFNTTNVTIMSSMFTNCAKLTDEALNNILYMCTNSNIKASNQKKLSTIGLTEAQATRCQSLSNYQDFLSAGWITGY